MLARLTRGLAAGDILLAHDGNAARADGRRRAVLLAVLPAARWRASTPLGLRRGDAAAARAAQRGDDAAAQPRHASASP